MFGMLELARRTHGQYPEDPEACVDSATLLQATRLWVARGM